mgnify:CR=1 FL=1
MEQNYDAQFGQLLRMETLKDVNKTVLRYDGRPFDPIELTIHFFLASRLDTFGKNQVQIFVFNNLSKGFICFPFAIAI